jgi:hypothetical protein
MSDIHALSQNFGLVQSPFLKIVICNKGLIDDTEVIFSINISNQMATLDLNCQTTCTSADCISHISSPLPVRQPLINGQPTVFLVHYHCYNMGDSFDPRLHPDCGAYSNKQAAMAVCRRIDVHGGVHGPEGNGELMCTEVALVGW